MLTFEEIADIVGVRLTIVRRSICDSVMKSTGSQ